MLLTAVVGVLNSGVSSARAQASEAERTATARSLFHEGVGFADQGRWEEAADRFRRALSLRGSPAVAYNLATALVQLRHYVEASEYLRQVSRDTTASAELKSEAESTLSQVNDRIGKLRVTTTGDVKGVTIQVDERTISEAEIGVPIPIDPGSHVIRAQRGTTVVATETAEIAEGQTVEATLALGSAPTPTKAQTALDRSLAPVGTEQASGSGGRKNKNGSIVGKWWFWTAIGVVAVGATATVILLSSGKEDPISGNVRPGVLVWP